ncbi:YafY family protein [Micromonospora sp. HK10]|uniref:helix-turn-helix transcriptional regulator n=1 Tax=Micromonospora sp. HK10 TaxID=1538294 RepID=UPI0006271D1D|nr:YafY family protein [Micromonospora sp. HK10]KKJ95840.1 transcriptional regulator [Micromonospora sp. HK10]
MANTSSRTLRLLSLLQTHRHWSGPELAGRLGVSERTLRRDVERLRQLGYPVGAARGSDGGYQLAPGAVLPPLLLDDEEAVALAVGVGDAAQSGIAGMQESSLRALTKVVRVLPPRLRARVDTLRAMTLSAVTAGPVVAAEVLTVVAQACRDEERLRFGYTARGSAPSEREVEPHRLVALGGRWYLVAYDLARHDWRSFRLDRLTGPAATGAHFRPRRLPAEDPVAFVQAASGAPAPYTVEALVHAPAARVRQAVGSWGTVEPVDQGSCRLTMTSTSLDWPTQALGNVGVEFEVLGPPEFAAHVQEWGGRFLRATRVACGQDREAS